MAVDIAISYLVGISAIGFLGSLLMDQITKGLFSRHNEYWMTIGAPGGWYWCPRERRYGENFMVTRKFWVERQFSYPELREIDRYLYVRYRLFLLCQLVAFLLFLTVVFMVIVTSSS